MYSENLGHQDIPNIGQIKVGMKTFGIYTLYIKGVDNQNVSNIGLRKVGMKAVRMCVVSI